MRLILEGQQKYLQSFINNATYHSMNPDSDVTYQTVNLFSSNKCFICFISNVQHYIQSHYIQSNQHNSVGTILVKFDKLDRCTWYLRSNDMFVLWNRISAIFIKIKNTVYTSFQNSALLFINGLIFDIINIQNSQSLEFEWIPMLAPLRSVSDRKFLWLLNVSLSLSKIGWILFSNSKETFKKILDGQKMFIS